MEHGVNWLAFLAAMAAIELTPGPNMGWLAALSAREGRRAGFAAVGGVALGLFLQVLAAATGLAALAAASPPVFEALRWSGVAYMVYLAYDAWRDGGEATAHLTSDALQSFRRGLIANVLNPKALVFYMAVVGQFTTPAAGPVWLQIVLLGLVHLAIATLVHAAIVISGARLGASLARWRRAPFVRAGFAVSLLLVAGWVAISTG